MRVKFFLVPALDPREGEEELNRFLAAHRILAVDRELVSDRSGTFWSICLSYSERSSFAAPVESKKTRIDYKEKLSAEDFEVYAALRELRKSLAERDGVPPYVIFNNAQLAEMVVQKARTKEELERISGVGPSKVEAYGELFLTRLVELQAIREEEG